MTTEPTQTDAPVKPIESLDDPRVIQILSTEHWSLLGARSLAYNEAFVRGGMFLTFLSMSFVALALLAQGMSFGTQFLTIAAIVLAFDFSSDRELRGRLGGATFDDLPRPMAWRAFATPPPRRPIRVPTSRPPRRDVYSVLTPTSRPDTSRHVLYAITTSWGIIGSSSLGRVVLRRAPC